MRQGRTGTIGLLFPELRRRRAVKKWEEHTRGKQALEGKYANHVQIGVSESEVVLDFGQYFLEEDQPRFHTRIIMTPLDARALLETLRRALDQSHN
jgi:hypothetical protein